MDQRWGLSLPPPFPQIPTALHRQTDKQNINILVTSFC